VLKVGLVLTLAYTKCVEDRRQEREGLRDPVDLLGFPSTLRKTPQRHLEHVWNGVRGGRFLPRVSVWIQGVYIVPLSFFSSCLLLQSQCLSHLDHFLDYVAHKVRKRGERKTNKA